MSHDDGCLRPDRLLRRADHVSVAVALTVLAAVELLELHGVDGQVAYLNVAEISELRAPGSRDLSRHFAPGARCIVVMGNAKWLAVRESCADIRQKIVAKMS